MVKEKKVIRTDRKRRCYKKKKRIEKVILVKQRNNLTKKKKRGEREKRPWSDLPAGLLKEIMVRNYSWADKIRFRAVCKSWQQLPIDDTEINKLPWLVTGDWTTDNNNNDVLDCKLFHPKHPGPYSVSKILFKDRRVRIRSRKHGWLLFEKIKHNNNNKNPTCFFLLFSPFTQQFIHLPELDGSLPGMKSESALETITHATFSSSDPNNDPDCEFFVLRDLFYPGDWNKIVISTCRRGDQNWTTRVFVKRIIQADWYGRIRQVVYSTQMGYLCCFTNFRSFAAYSVSRKEWIQLNNNPQQMQLLDGMSYARPHLMECEGGLLVLNHRIAPNNYDGGCSLFKFSWSSSSWNMESCLPNQAIFLGPTTSFLVPASGDIANKMYYYDLECDQNMKFYCFKDRQTHKYRRAAAAADDDDSLHRGWLVKGLPQSFFFNFFPCAR